MSSELIYIAKNILNESSQELVESKTEIYAYGVTPDGFRFEGSTHPWREGYAAFAFFGTPPGVFTYIKNTDGKKNAPATHWTLFDKITSMLKRIDDVGLKNLKLNTSRVLTPADIEYAVKKQKTGEDFDVGIPRKRTRAGRVWTNIKSVTLGKRVNIIIFWCKENDVLESDLEIIKKEFKLSNILWAASNSKRYNLYDKDDKKLTKNDSEDLHSKLFPNLTHDEILAILIKAHTATVKLSPIEDKVVKEFRGSADMDRVIKKVTGGYDTPAEYNYRSRMSEENERLIRIAHSILNETSDGTIKISTDGSTPDDLHFDGIWKEWFESSGPVAFIGRNNGLLINDPDGYNGNHPDLFAHIAYIEKDSGLNIKDYLKDNRISIFGNPTRDDIEYAYTVQGIDERWHSMSKSRIATRAGRLWRNLHSRTFNKTADVIVFWCKEGDIRKSDLISLKKNLKLKDFYWAATNSQFFNHYGDKIKDTTNVKNLHSKQYPKLSHDEIVNILIKAHTAGTKLAPYEKEVVREFRGSADVDNMINNMKKKAGGFSTMAQRNAAMWTSEETEIKV